MALLLPASASRAISRPEDATLARASAIAIVAWGFDATQTLVMSQVVLNLVLPVPLLALTFFTNRRRSYVNRRVTRIVALLATLIIIALNALLVLDSLGLMLPQ